MPATDLAEQHSTSAVYLASDVYKQNTVEGLARVRSKIKSLQQHLAEAPLDPPPVISARLWQAQPKRAEGEKLEL